MLARVNRTVMLVFACLFLAGGAHADLYTIDRIPVDVRAESAAAAQTQALTEARAEALRQVMQRLTRESDHPALPLVPDIEIENMLTSFQVSGEKTGPDRYIADISFQFQPEAVKLLLRQNQIELTESRALPMLVIPVLTVGGEASIWTDPNPWLDAWAGLDQSRFLVPPAVPFGDVEDVVLLTAEQALTGDATALQVMAERYGAESVLVVDAALTVDAVTGAAMLDVRANPFFSAEFQPMNLQLQGEVKGDATPFMTAAAEMAMRMVDNQWKDATILRFSIVNRLTALVPLAGLGDWLDVSRSIDNVYVVRGHTLRALTVRDALIDLEYGGDPEDLQRAMLRAGLQLQPEEDGYWLILRRGADQ